MQSPKGNWHNVQPEPLRHFQLSAGHRLYGGDDKLVAGTNDIPTRPSLPQGFGRIHLDRLLSSLSQQFYNESHTFVGSGSTFESRILTVRDFAKPVIVALVWTDAAGMAGVDSPLVNNLDLKVNFTSTQWYIGNSFVANPPSGPDSETSILYTTGASPVYDSVNNVELVKFMPTNNEFRVRVIATSVTGDGIPGWPFNDQDFSLWIYNAW